tara:strand:- start:922 stop:1071 length:150 start_codon:yes stop_codon:yes gene_type:complete
MAFKMGGFTPFTKKKDPPKFKILNTKEELDKMNAWMRPGVRELPKFKKK